MPTANGIDERVIVDIWERQAFEMSGLASAGLRVLFRGSPSDAGGPDYQDAMLIRGESELVAGDVEFHVRSADWFRHGHHRDARYNNVVLHVVWQDDGATAIRRDGEAVPTLVLRDCTPARPLGREGAFPLHPCTAAYGRCSRDEILSALQECGRRRFEDRTSRLAADLTAADPDQVLYTALLEACGYASNRTAFRILAEAAPYPWIIALRSEDRLGALLDAAGLGPPSEPAPPARLPLSSWRLARLRPANHPEKRLAGISAILDRHGPRVAETLTDMAVGARSAAELRSALQSPGDQTGLGAGRADEMVVSVLLPFVSAAGRAHEAWQMYRQYPSPPANRWTRHMLGLLASAGHDIRVRGAVEHQGLHFLYHSYCRLEGASGCPICSRH